MTQKEDIQNAVDVMRKGGVILYLRTRYGVSVATRRTRRQWLRCTG